MMTTTKCRNLHWMKVGATLTCLTIGVAWSAHSRADDETRPVVVAVAAPRQEQPVRVAAPRQEQLVRLPALKVGGIRSGDALMITESGTESMKFAEMAQRPVQKKQTLFSDFCNAH
jgi:hypothetical protein